jgi:D-arabinose 1-dehydrogenase-like Zn-dependent alcohol dehydrogenase
LNICTVRGVLVGSRSQFEEMNRAIEACKIKPVVDKKVFTLEQTKESVKSQLWMESSH